MIEQATSNKPNKSRTGDWFLADKTCLKRPASEPILILESFDRQTLAKMAIALEQACGAVSTGNQKHRSRRYIAKRIVTCAFGGNRDLNSLTRAAIAAAEELNASRAKNSVAAPVRAPDNRRSAGVREIAVASGKRRSTSAVGVQGR
jgi:hypothetical protein